ncbi:MAG TPA: DoxX family protein [Candidatus Polarisedimenticolia bacterium]|nr:DoxX family protein [Candidatus Polarisedimenticolia bacterium]
MSAAAIAILKDPTDRAKSIGMSKAFTIFVGSAEVAGGLGVAFGVLTQLAAFALKLIMFGAIQKKIFTWAHRFWGKKGLALRCDVCPDEPGRGLHQSWPSPMAARTS